MFLQNIKNKEIMANSFRLLIQTPDKICFNENISQIDFCSEQGKLSILPNHCSIIGCIYPIPLTIHLLTKKTKIAICNQGFFKFDNNELIILTNFFSFREDFDQKLFTQRKTRLISLIKKLNMPQKIYEKFDNDFNLFFHQLKNNQK